ncbi:hypothetical protein CFC21_079610 [Triticum aestivum]|uniref:GDSL esterase/lipase n=3 Tax=Triticinae TaxID=1648030 RepID=A0A9R1I098_WHEAT|nr:GDSL esterase/lipase At5g22810 [Aegilops tauschii subsp. strangulata]XP_044399231.1 GDSL esterase/lipase At5g22810-like [Triticum aestivum]KAF7074790.1 hypothetical protein CFC21_079610 [Triticum aestivum]
MARWPAAAVACALGAALLGMLAVTADEQGSNSKFTCTDTEKKRPGCTGTCPDRCPQSCISLCPSCQTYCPDQVQPVRPALFVFGDGFTDVGNNNYLENNEVGNPVRANHSYYGIDFPNSVATGRFSNGFNLADFIAKAMGFEMSPPPYLSLNSPTKMDAGFAGVNYASATSGIWRDIDTGLDIPLMDQVKNFADTIGQMGANRSQQDLSKMLSNSLFLVSTGTTDLYSIYNINNNGGSDTKTNVPHLISSYGDSLTALYNLGARKFGIINVPTLCTAVVRHGCEGLITSLRVEFNDGIKPLMAGLASNLSGLRYSIADFHAFSDAVNMNPSAYGFVNTGGACCQGSCAPGSGLPCANRSQYWYWDEEYPTEQAAKLAASAFFNGTTQFTTPMNFKMLINQK